MEQITDRLGQRILKGQAVAHIQVPYHTSSWVATMGKVLAINHDNGNVQIEKEDLDHPVWIPCYNLLVLKKEL